LQTTMPLRRRTSRLQRTTGDFAAIFAATLLIATLGLMTWWQGWHSQRIFTGVTVAGVPVGGASRSAALARVQEAMLAAPLPAISVEYGGRQWAVTADDVRAAPDLLGAVNQAYLVGRQGDWSERLNQQLVSLLGGVDIAPALTVDTSQLRYTLGQIAAEVRQPARAGILLGDTTIPAQAGVDVDIETTVEALAAALRDRTTGQPVLIPFATIEQAPPTEVIDTRAPVELLTATRGALLLQDARFGLEFALDPATLQSLTASDGKTLVEAERLVAILQSWAAQIDVAPRDARLRFDRATQSPVVVQTSRAGRRLDVEATMATIRGALSAELPRADLMVVTVPPAVDSNRVAEMGIRELIASGTSYFQGSSRERLVNIEVAAAKFENIVLPPNGIFSFNQWVEDVSAANGFEDSLIIWGDRTAVGIGGGVCQVSTTIFRAAYNAGLPMVERYNHGYIVDWYGEPGLDATIFTPTVDFRFRNDTGAYMLIEPVNNSAGGVLTFNLYGTKPNRQVIIGEPVQSDIRPAPPPLYTVDPSLAPGQRKQVDWEKPGMTVTVTRTIIENGQTRTDTLVSKYQPWRAIYLVGSEADIPASARTDTTQ
jgi:vancomycin resistance protein YoaR